MNTGFDYIPQPLVQAWCSRCRKPAGLWRADSSGAGAWQQHHRKRCRCDPPPPLPEGAALDRLVERARRSVNDGRQRPTNVSC